MNFKNKIVYFALSVFIALTAMSCEVIGESDRYISMGKIGKTDRIVLLEEITGQLCTNCPAAAEEAKRLQTLYGEENVILVTIHAGGLSFATFQCEAGLAYAAKFNPNDSNPFGIFDRKLFSNHYQTWGTPMQEVAAQKAEAAIDLTVLYDSVARQATVNTTVLSLGDKSNVKLQLLILESGMVARQTLQDGTVDPNYVHKHVLRDAINGTWGEDMVINQETLVEKTNTYTLKSNWKAKNMDVVAFVYDPVSFEVLQAAKVALIE